jgi:hypothetical protein
MTDEKPDLPACAEDVVLNGKHAVIYFDGQALQATSISRHPMAPDLLICRAADGTTTIIDTREIRGVVEHRSTREEN